MEVTQVSLRIRLSVLTAVVAAGLSGVAGAAGQQPSAVYTSRCVPFDMRDVAARAHAVIG